MENNIKSVYFLGIGGIGMSAIARYYLHSGVRVGGYDRTETPLTRALAAEGADIHYVDDIAQIGVEFRSPESTLAVYTPAVPKDHSELNWFRQNGFKLQKRAEVLGILSHDKYVMAVAGTHGKTTTTTLTAWLNHTANNGSSAFLGGISKNFNSNFVYSPGEIVTVEADEFDRSFLHLAPNAAVITSTDADHLDIYGTHEELLQAFADFAARIKPGGTLIIKKGLRLPSGDHSATHVYTYACGEEADFYADNIRTLWNGCCEFDMVFPDRRVEGCRMGVPGLVNVENAVAAAALVWTKGIDDNALRSGLSTFSGVRRRFDIHVNKPGLTYIDDYAHHPAELRATLTSIRRMYPDRRITAVFQPHLYSRTKDFYSGFAESLSLADEVILLPIYPARELPIEGVTSEMIGRLLTVPWEMTTLERLPETVLEKHPDIIITFGAGNIDTQIDNITRLLDPDPHK